MRTKIKSKLVKAIIEFILPAGLLMVVYALAGIMPFGEKSILTGDCTIQYSAFLTYFKEILSGNVSVLYTFSKVLGGDLSSFLSYYVLSPFNLLLVFFESSQIQEAVLVLTLVKTGCAGLSMSFYLTGKYKGWWRPLLFSTAYALMGYNFAYQNNIMWLDGVVFLPLLVAGLEKMLSSVQSENKQRGLYLSILSLMLITNYYIGYMICIFMAIYAIYYIIFDDNFTDITWNKRLYALKNFILTSILAGGLSAVSILPTIMSLRGGKASFQLKDLFDFSILYSPGDVWKELFIGNAALKNNFHTLPNIYCGIFILLFAILYFCKGTNKLKEKLGSLLVLFFLYISFMISCFDRIWHGTTVPAGSPHRYSFIFSFFLILIAYKGFCSLINNELSKRNIIVGIAFYIISLLLYIWIRGIIDIFVWINVIISLLLLLFLLYYILAFRVINQQKNSYISKLQRHQKRTFILLTFVVIVELSISGYCTVQANEYSNYYEFKKRVSQVQENIDIIKAKDDGWYRMEQYGTNVTMNDAMMFQYNGLWSYSSCEKEATKRLAGKLGLNDRSWWITYHNEMPASAESFLGLKYIITNRPVLHNDYGTVEKHSQSGIQIYQNPYALPVGFLVNEDTIETNFDTWDVLAIQNDLWKRMTGNEENIYLNANGIETRCESHLIEYQLKVKEELPIYTCFRNYGTIERMTVAVNGREIRAEVPEMQTYCIGTFQKGDVVTVTITNKNTEEDMSWYDLYFYYENMTQLIQYSKLLQSQDMDLQESKHSRIIGNVNNQSARGSLLLFTIPAENGWTVLVDGIAKPIQSISGGFMAVSVEPGQHEIELKFIPVGLWQGGVISLTTLCLLVVISMKKSFKRTIR